MQVFTSESVTEGHPDKLCDAISDAILDNILSKDPHARVAIETMITHGTVFIGGEITTDCYVDIPTIARGVIRDAGYTDPAYGFHFENCGIVLSIHEQSKDIAQGVVKTKSELMGAGDQGCLKKGTLVRTKRGFVPIEKVTSEDYVATPYGWRQVVKSSMTGRKRLIEIIFTNGAALKCTPDHKILCYRKDSTLYWKAASDLIENELVCALKPQEVFSQDSKVSYISRKDFFTKYNHKIFGPEEITLDSTIGYMAGELIGDGYVANTHCMELAFGTNRTHAAAVQAIIHARMPNQWRLIEKNGSTSLKIDPVLVRKHFENFGVRHAKAPYKTTPPAIFTSPQEVIRSYLRGLFDSDGTIVINSGRDKKNVRIRLCSSSLLLLRETQLLLNDSHIKSSILRNRPAGTVVGRRGHNGKLYRSRHENYVLSLTGFESYQRFCKEIGFFDIKKHERALAYLEMNPTKSRNSKGIFLIPNPVKNEMIAEEKIGKNLPFALVSFQKKEDSQEIDEVYDLEIEGVHTFSANGIFVHNSMFGYATDETSQLMPLPIMLAHALTRRLAHVRRKKILPYLRPDGKAQVTVRYENDSPVHVEAVVVAAQHNPGVPMDTLRKDIKRHVSASVIPAKFLDARTKYFINETDRFVLGGPQADTGLTGRKIISDTYGGVGSHGGGAFSGKDPTKVDRSGAYMARSIAKHIVAAKLAKRCEVQVAYAIGVAHPLSFSVNTFGTGALPDEKLTAIAQKVFDLRPGMIIKHLGLQKPLYRQVATYGHFGRNDLRNIPWERLNKLAELKKAARY